MAGVWQAAALGCQRWGVGGAGEWGTWLEWGLGGLENWGPW
jgi:hypothetical protein